MRELPLPIGLDAKLMSALKNVGIESFSNYQSYDHNDLYRISRGYVEKGSGWVELIYVTPTQINIRLEVTQHLHDKFAQELGIKANKKAGPRPPCAAGVVHSDYFNQPIEFEKGVIYSSKSGGLSCGTVIGWTAKQVKVRSLVTKSWRSEEYIPPDQVFVMDQDLFMMKALIS
jgi:hypothetical protein